MRRGLHYLTVPRHVEVMAHAGSDRSVREMVEWVDDLRLRGLVGPGVALRGLVDDGAPVGRLHVGPGVDALIAEGGHLVFRPDPRGGVGMLEVVDGDRFYREFQRA
jgi:hypothetical protein